jgi:hypothetical protein
MMHKRFINLPSPKLKYFKSREAPSKGYYKYYLGAGTVGVLGGVYYYTHLEQVPISGRTRFMNTSPRYPESHEVWRNRWELKLSTRL